MSKHSRQEKPKIVKKGRINLQTGERTCGQVNGQTDRRVKVDKQAIKQTDRIKRHRQTDTQKGRGKQKLKTDNRKRL